MPDADIGVAVVGGGISGLAAAYELHLCGVGHVVLEGGTRFGGVIRTDRVDGFTIDGGPDSLLAQKPAALDLCRELGLGDRLVPTLPPRTAYVLRAGRLHPLPQDSVLGIPTRLRPLAKTRLLTAAGKARVALDLLLPGGASAGRHDESIASFFERRFGREAVDYIAEPLLAGIHAGNVDRLSMQALFPRLVEAERTHGSVIRALAAGGPGGRTPDGPFRSLPGGVGELTDALCAALPARALRTGAGVRELRGPAPYRLRLAGGTSVTARQVVLAVPAQTAAELLRPLDPELASICGAVPHTSSATVTLGYPRDAIRHDLRGTGFVVPRVERGLSVMAGTWVSSKWPDRAPHGQALLRGFVGGARDAAALDRTDAELINSVHRDLARLLDIRGRPALARVYRWPRLNPQYEVGHLERLAAIDARLDRLPGIHLIGAGFRGVGIPDCITRGRAAGAAASRAVQSAAP